MAPGPVLAAILCLGLAACGDRRVEVTSNVDGARIIPFTELGIVVRKNVGWNGGELPGLLASAMRACGIGTIVDVRPLVTPALSARLIEPPPGGETFPVFIIDDAGVPGDRSRSALWLRLPSGQVAWRGLLEVGPGFGLLPTGLDRRLAAAILNRLISDNVIPGTCAVLT